MIALSGQSGFIGDEFVNFLKKKKIKYKCINFSKKYSILSKICSNKEIKKINKCSHYFHFASSLNPKSNQDYLFNEKIPNYIFKKINKEIKFIYISSINVLVKDRIDNYTNTKRTAEKSLKSKKNLIIVRLPLVLKFKQKKIVNIGPAKKIFRIIDFFPLIIPSIYPGHIYNPVDVMKLNKFLLKILKRKNQFSYNILGRKKLSFFEIIKLVASSRYKKVLKINTILLKKIAPMCINIYLRKQNNFLNQLIQVDNSKFKGKITYI
jgi:dTDP-4-dehydrorhamnose reductase